MIKTYQVWEYLLLVSEHLAPLAKYSLEDGQPSNGRFQDNRYAPDERIRPAAHDGPRSMRWSAESLVWKVGGNGLRWEGGVARKKCRELQHQGPAGSPVRYLMLTPNSAFRLHASGYPYLPYFPLGRGT